MCVRVCVLTLQQGAMSLHKDVQCEYLRRMYSVCVCVRVCVRPYSTRGDLSPSLDIQREQRLCVRMYSVSTVSALGCTVCVCACLRIYSLTRGTVSA